MTIDNLNGLNIVSSMTKWFNDIESLSLIRDSLKYTMLKFSEYPYPSQEYREQRIEEVASVSREISARIRELKDKRRKTK
jgi:hypothetical protein